MAKATRDDIPNAPKEMSRRRASAWKRRQTRRVLTKATAKEALGELKPKVEIFGFTKGQFSLIDIIEHCLDFTGPADVTICSWTAGMSDQVIALGFLGDGRIRTLRFIVDFSFPTRQKAYCSALRERFGDEAIRLTNVHAKFVMIRNKGWNLVIRSSMNLNEARRLEWFEISDDPGMADYVEELVLELWGLEADGAQFSATAFDNKETLEKLGQKEIRENWSWYGDGALARDVRRTGLSTSKGKRIK